MHKTIQLIAMIIFFGMFSNAVFADTNCEMPPGIDDGETYWIKFKTESKMYRYKIEDIDDCWVQIWKKDGNHYWYQIDDISVITSKPEED